MKAIRDKAGIITHYEDWRGDKHSAEIIFQSIKNIQYIQLHQWKDKLNDKLMGDLMAAVADFNTGKTAQNFNAYDLKRGTSFDNFIGNWSPGKPLNEIYW